MFVICIKDRLLDRHLCLNLYPCVIKVQSVSQSVCVEGNVAVLEVAQVSVSVHLQGYWECLMSLPLSGISGLSFDSTLLSPVLFFLASPVTLSVLSFFCLLAHSPELLPENSSIFLVKRLAFFGLFFGMAPV